VVRAVDIGEIEALTPAISLRHHVHKALAEQHMEGVKL
jgi:hypothetical protein